MMGVLYDVNCIECKNPMWGVKDIAARTTCHECGGKSLCTHAQPKEESAIEVRKSYVHKTYIPQASGGAA